MNNSKKLEKSEETAEAVQISPEIKKFNISTELTYIVAILLTAIATAFTVRANFGVSMVVAPARLIFLKLKPILPFLTFGMTEYTFQALLIFTMMIAIRKFKFSFFFSIATAVIYGFTYDLVEKLVILIPNDTIYVRILCYVLGVCIISLSVALFFKTYISAEAYEMFIKEIASKYNIPLPKFKSVYDLSSLGIAIIMSFIFFGSLDFTVVGIGTVISALLNGVFIGFETKFMDKHFNFVDSLPLRKYFE